MHSVLLSKRKCLILGDININTLVKSTIVPTELASSLPKADRHFASFLKGENAISALLR